MKYWKPYGMKFILGIMTVMFLLCGCSSKETYEEDSFEYNSKPFALYEIELSGHGGGMTTKDPEIKYNSKKLQKIIDQAGNIYVYGNPKSSGEEIAALFGFDKDSWEPYGGSDKERIYRDKTNSKKTLEIDAYGCFTYNSGLEPVNRNCDFSDKECMEMGRNYLLDLNLWPRHQINDKGRISVISNTSGGVTTTVEKGINFYPKDIGGRLVSGTKRISVFFNADSEVTNISYSWREYESRRDANLISVDEAIEKIKEGKFKMDYSDEDFGSAAEISIKDVTVSYWDEPRNTEETAVQPVYIFSGTAKDKMGHKSKIYITVQANSYSE